MDTFQDENLMFPMIPLRKNKSHGKPFFQNISIDRQKQKLNHCRSRKCKLKIIEERLPELHSYIAPHLSTEYKGYGRVTK